MKLDVPDEYLPLIVTALEHYSAYARAVQREDSRYQEAADWFKSPSARSKEPEIKSKTQTGLRFDNLSRQAAALVCEDRISQFCECRVGAIPGCGPRCYPWSRRIPLRVDGGLWSA